MQKSKRMPMQTETATEAFVRLEEESKKLMKSVKEQLALLSKKQKKEPKNWGYHGSMGYVVEKLEQIDNFLKGTDSHAA